MNKPEDRSPESAEFLIQENGPVKLTGEFTLTRADGQTIDVDGDVYLCRCGGSKNKPFCDGSHRSVGIRK
jgi:CDGSH-type Zn-finger protein